MVYYLNVASAGHVYDVCVPRNQSLAVSGDIFAMVQIAQG